MHENDFKECPSPSFFPLAHFSFFFFFARLICSNSGEGTGGKLGTEKLQKKDFRVYFIWQYDELLQLLLKTVTVGILQLSIALSATGLLLIPVWFASPGMRVMKHKTWPRIPLALAAMSHAGRSLHWDRAKCSFCLYKLLWHLQVSRIILNSDPQMKCKYSAGRNQCMMPLKSRNQKIILLPILQSGVLSLTSDIYIQAPYPFSRCVR